jgi:hypothetical protein
MNMWPGILYDDGFLKDERLLISFFCENPKNTNEVGGWKLKFVFCFTETTHEPFYLLDKWRLVEWKIVDIPTSFVWIIVLFNEVFQYGDGAKF